MNMRMQLVLAVLVACCLPACSKRPDKSRPWAVVLDEAATQAMAEKLLASFKNKKNAAMEDAAALAIRDRGVVRHIVISRGFAARTDAEKLAGRLSGGAKLRLPLVDLSKVEIPGEEDEQFGGIPEGLQAIENLAAALPTPGAENLESFLLVPDAARQCSRPEDFGGVAPSEWRQGFCRLGFSATAEAAYGIPGPNGVERALVFVGVGRGPSGHGGKEVGEKQDILRDSWGFLLAHRAPSPEEWERTKKEIKRARHRRRRRRLPAPVVTQDSAGVIKLPAPQKRLLPWGNAPVFSMTGVTLMPSKNYREGTVAWTAWMARLPGGNGVWLALFKDEPAVKGLFEPVGLGEPHGIAYLPEFLRPWTLLPEVAVEDEYLVFLGTQRFGRWLQKKQRPRDWAKRNAGRTITGAGFAKGEKRWRVNWIDFGSEAEAKLVFSEGFVAPRQEIMQRALKSKRQVRYELGVNLVEVGDTNAWYFKGARHGRRREMYFGYKTRVWLFSTPQGGEQGLAEEDLLARVELLQIWDVAK
ncbi:MAG TPA: hypothetical protein VM425_15650 [Myxococcota bacterium]|nr:hypothetical protein [Myxococcota bacterium]